MFIPTSMGRPVFQAPSIMESPPIMAISSKPVDENMGKPVL